MVIDTSAILAVFFAEEHGPWVAGMLELHAGELVMSTVNLTETLIHLKDRQPALYDDLEARLLGSSIRFVPPDAEQARVAAAARLKYPLNLGDCFAYALAVAMDCPVLTLDSDFKATGRTVPGPTERPPQQ